MMKIKNTIVVLFVSITSYIVTSSAHVTTDLTRHEGGACPLNSDDRHPNDVDHFDASKIRELIGQFLHEQNPDKILCIEGALKAALYDPRFQPNELIMPVFLVVQEVPVKRVDYLLFACLSTILCSHCFEQNTESNTQMCRCASSECAHRQNLLEKGKQVFIGKMRTIVDMLVVLGADLESVRALIRKEVKSCLELFG